MIGVYSTLLALTIAFLVGLTLWFFRRPAAPKEVKWECVVAEAAQGDYRLITTDELVRRYQKDPHSLMLVDTRPEGECRAGHIRGAVNFPLMPTWWGMWRSRRLLATILEPDKERLVVFY